jgi:RHS repeat-associated protein
MQNSSSGYDRASHRKWRHDDLARALRVTLSTDGTAASGYPVATNGNNSAISRAYAYDAIGNPAAAYRYDPYGLLVSATGPEKDRFRHRFSTKPQDRETGLLYYGYRYLETTTGRWPSRDPIGERGGLNLYGFVFNSAINWADVLGLEGYGPTLDGNGRWHWGSNTPSRRGGFMPTPSSLINPSNTVPINPTGIYPGTGKALELMAQIKDFIGELGKIRTMVVASEIAHSLPEICRMQRNHFYSPMSDGCGCCLMEIGYVMEYPGGILEPITFLGVQIRRGKSYNPSGDPVGIAFFSAQYVPVKCDKAVFPTILFDSWRTEVRRAKEQM